MKVVQSMLSTTLALASVFTVCRCVPLTQVSTSQGAFDLDTIRTSNVAIIVVSTNLSAAIGAGSLQKQATVVDAKEEVLQLIGDRGSTYPVPSPWQNDGFGVVCQMSTQPGTERYFTYGVLQDMLHILDRREQASGYKQSTIKVWLDNGASGHLIAQGSLTMSGSLQTASNGSAVISSSSGSTSKRSTITVPLVNNSVANLMESLQKQPTFVEVSIFPESLPLLSADFDRLINDTEEEVSDLISTCGSGHSVPQSWRHEAYHMVLQMNRRFGREQYFTYGALIDVVQALKSRVPGLLYLECEITVKHGLDASGPVIARGTLTDSDSDTPRIVLNASALASKFLVDTSKRSTIAVPLLNNSVANLTRGLQKQAFYIDVEPEPFPRTFSSGSFDALLLQAEVEVQRWVAMYGSTHPAREFRPLLVHGLTLSMGTRCGREEHFTLAALMDVFHTLNVEVPKIQYKTCSIRVRLGSDARGMLIAQGTVTLARPRGLSTDGISPDVISLPNNVTRSINGIDESQKEPVLINELPLRTRGRADLADFDKADTTADGQFNDTAVIRPALSTNATAMNGTGASERAPILVDVSSYPEYPHFSVDQLRSFLDQVLQQIDGWIRQYGEDHPAIPIYERREINIILQMTRSPGGVLLYTYGVMREAIAQLREHLQQRGFFQCSFRVYAPAVGSSWNLIARGNLFLHGAGNGVNNTTTLTGLALPSNASEPGLPMFIADNSPATRTLLLNGSSIAVPLPNNDTVGNGNMTAGLRKNAIWVSLIPIPGAVVMEPYDFFVLVTEAEQQTHAWIDQYGADHPALATWQHAAADTIFEISRVDGRQAYFTFGVLLEVIRTLLGRIPAGQYRQCEFLVILGLDRQPGDTIARGSIQVAGPNNRGSGGTALSVHVQRATASSKGMTVQTTTASSDDVVVGSNDVSRIVDPLASLSVETS